MLREKRAKVVGGVDIKGIKGFCYIITIKVLCNLLVT